MASRKERKDVRDFFPTPPWSTRALYHAVLPHLAVYGIGFQTVWEPACGEGHMAAVLGERFGDVYATDLYDYGYGAGGCDFLKYQPNFTLDWIITNPPYSRAEKFALRALDLAREGVALFVRTQFLETIGRYERLFLPKPPTLIAHFAERVPICKGRWDPKKGTASAYCWLVWIRGRDPLPTFWIPPGQRDSLSRPDDIARFAAWSLPQQEAAE